MALVAALALSACTDLAYYQQAVGGHVRVMAAARSVPDWLADPATPAALQARLVLAQHLRRFAVTDLHLPDNASYQRYADLHRPAVVWNVVAAPPDALTLKTWCFVLAGCVSYRGYFDIAEAQTLARTLQAQGLEVGVYGVPAYSTLGWSNWVGGDPLLNTFIGQPDAELARLLFHELAHQVVYVADDSMFNESFATAVERLGVAQWLARHASPEQRAQYAQREQRRQAFRALTQTIRRELAAVYARPSAQQSAADLAAAKAALMQQFRQQYADLKRDWVATAEQHPAASDAAVEAAQRAADAWVARANNASFAALGVYDELVPGFEALYAQDPAWDHFYATVRELAQRPKDERRRGLQAAVEAQSKLATKSM